MTDPHLIAAEWYLGGFDSERLPEVALQAIEHGCEGKNLSQLATLMKPSKRDVEGLVDGALRELGVTAPLSKDEAALWILGSVKASAGSGKITALNLVGKLLTAFPELEGRYVEEVKSYYGLPGNYWVIAVILKPVLTEQISKKDGADFVHRIAQFFELVCTSGDNEAVNVLWIEIFEWLVHSHAGELQFLWPILGPSTKAVIKEVAFRRKETENLPS
ncbi:MAG: hypothetical protein ACHQIK_20500 [Candidatus Acidiferrales bacterium]